MSIEIGDVRRTPWEMRPIYRVWPAARWWGYSVRLAFGLLYLVTIGVAWWFSTAQGFAWIVVCLCALVYAPLALGWVGAKRISLVARATPLGGAITAWRLDLTGIRVSNAFSMETLDWRGVVRVVEEKDRIIFAATPTRNYVLPMRCLAPGQLEALRALIADLRITGRLGAGVDYPTPASDKA